MGLDVLLFTQFNIAHRKPDVRIKGEIPMHRMDAIGPVVGWMDAIG